MLIPMGLRLSEEKTVIVHIDEGFDFLGMHIQRHKKLGADKTLRLHLPVTSRSGVREGKGAWRHPRDNEPVALRTLEPAQPGSSRMDQLPPPRGVVQDLLLPVGLHLAPGLDSGCGTNIPRRRSRNCGAAISRDGGLPQDKVRLFKPDAVAIVRYRYRGAAIPSPWAISQAVA